ncbi:MAG TPA: hypothetical protein VMC05_02530 [Xanthobacteraceae bacterium]|nr:hypothetical protein [Xanthobacteraceae bacterium]
MDDGDLHRDIERLEDDIEALEARIDNCRKFILAGRVAAAVGFAVLAAMFFGLIRTELGWMTAAMAATIGGIVVFGTNSSTTNEARKELAAAQARRLELIGQLELRDVSIAPTLH